MELKKEDLENWDSYSFAGSIVYVCRKCTRAYRLHQIWDKETGRLRCPNCEKEKR